MSISALSPDLPIQSQIPIACSQLTVSGTVNAAAQASTLVNTATFTVPSLGTSSVYNVIYNGNVIITLPAPTAVLPLIPANQFVTYTFIGSTLANFTVTLETNPGTTIYRSNGATSTTYILTETTLNVPTVTLMCVPATLANPAAPAWVVISSNQVTTT